MNYSTMNYSTRNYSTRLLCGLIAAGTLVAGCGGGGSSDEDYAAVRAAMSEAVDNDAGVTIEFSNAEIDCIAAAQDMSVAELAEEASASTDDELTGEEEAELFSCISNDNFRTLMSNELEASNLAAAGVDEDCVVDELTSLFEKWKQSGGSVDDMDMLEGEEMEASVLGCMSDS